PFLNQNFFYDFLFSYRDVTAPFIHSFEALAFSEDQHYLALICGRKIEVWIASNKVLGLSLELPDFPKDSVEVHLLWGPCPDETMGTYTLACAVGNKIFICSFIKNYEGALTNEKIVQFVKYPDNVFGMHFSSDGKFLFSSSFEENIIRQWEVTTSKEIKQF